jgi:hypothetical protein
MFPDPRVISVDLVNPATAIFALPLARHPPAPANIVFPPTSPFPPTLPLVAVCDKNAHRLAK